MSKENKKISKAAMKRLFKSKFFHEVIEIVKAWDYYLITGERDLAKEMMDKWFIAKSALEFITGNTYNFSRNGKIFSIVNERNNDEKLLIGHSVKEMAA